MEGLCRGGPYGRLYGGRIASGAIKLHRWSYYDIFATPFITDILQALKSVTRISIVVLALLATSCSTKKNKALNKFWHNLNTHYNGWFNGNEAVKTGMMELSKSRRDNYNKIIPVFEYGDKSNWSNMNASSDRAIKKAVVMIKKHSMLINGKQYNKWIDDCYLMMGKAHFFKGEHPMAIGQFKYVADNSEKNTTKDEARIWMIKTYTEMGEFPDAGTVMRQVDKEALDTKLRWEYYAAAAQYFIRIQEWEQAIETLDKAILYTKKKKRIARYWFIKGQIYQVLNDNGNAYKSFFNVLKFKPEYELEFQSKINLAQTSENQSNEDLRKLLKKMLRDGKNVDYLDQIYYAMAIIDLKENKRDDGIKNLQNSIKNSTSNKTQKGLSFLKLAELYFAERKYEPAQAYYDSTAAFLDKDHPKYDEVIRLKDNLTAVVNDIRIVEKQDSLQKLGRMDEKELMSFLEDYVEDLKTKDEEAKLKGNVIDFTSGGVTQGKWYFYNPQTLSFGLNDFRKIWGNRALEDDWRRSNKGSNSFVESPEDTGGVNPRYDVNTYLAEIPRTDSAYQASNQMIYDALYDLGLVYKEKIEDYPRSAEAFENLVSRNTTNNHFPVTYYQLYLVYNTMKNTEKSDYYKKLLITQYPESEYAKMLGDPSYSVHKDDKDEAAPLYEAAYNLYVAGSYDQCRTACASALQQYPETKIEHRFALLSALCTGKLGTTEEFKLALEGVKGKYTNTESAVTADRLLKYMNGEASGNENNNGSLLNNVNGKVATFKYDPKAEHMFIIVVSDAAKKLDGAIAALNMFNDKNFQIKGLSVNNTLMGKNYQVLIIRKFNDAEDVMSYYKMFTSQGVLEKLNIGAPAKGFGISVLNYGVLFKQLNVDDYESFFKETYMGMN